VQAIHAAAKMLLVQCGQLAFESTRFSDYMQSKIGLAKDRPARRR
jgi:hypothetical protein